MNINLINEMRDLITWVRATTNKSANFEIDFWAHKSSENESIEYKIWVDGLIHKSSRCLEELTALIPGIKTFCELSKELAA